MTEEDFENLLDIQAQDTLLSQLNHQKETLPERQKINTVQAALEELTKHEASLTKKLGEIHREQKRLEDEAATDEAKVAEDEQSMAQMTSPKELQAKEQAVANRKNHLTSLEDQILEQMEKAEPLQKELDEVLPKVASSNGEIAELENTIKTAVGKLDEQIQQTITSRDGLAGKVQPGLLERYNQACSTHNGVGIAELIGAQCHGCDFNLTHPAAEVEKFQATFPKEIFNCSECGRMLATREKAGS